MSQTSIWRRAGERVLVHGGAGGVGSAAVQVAAALGAVLPPADVAQAHALLEGGPATGEGHRRRPRGKIAIAVTTTA
ncbi:hypothetical protein GPA10_12285 [Streptomyces sp. p1417]|uniref:Uncharacterized protein n=1 Tax=Streptomyces typhae TaxID=2681492 RepID=A0A6L6WVC4_9ACTN|nr:hypothetical protein [Streptomyces typhae]MVO85509.1 hypothetical protein [Streptomyces typhae]